MKIAITDACIFIDIIELQLTAAFFDLEIEIHTTVDVFNELHLQQRNELLLYRTAGKLKVHNLLEEDRKNISKMQLPKSLSATDKTVLYLAAQLDAIILSSDRVVRHNAKVRKIAYHGMLWIFDMLVEASLITQNEAAIKLKILIMTNIIYSNNAELVKEMNARFTKWSTNH